MTNPSTISSTGRASSLTLLLILTLLIAAALRFPGLFQNFWLDEIWSWKISRSLHGVLEILTSPAARIDNNHPLNTLFLYLLGDQLHWALYRLPSFLASLGTIALAVYHASRQGRSTAVFIAFLLTFSYPLILYSTEARGYSLLLFFCVASFISLSSYHRIPSFRSAFFFIFCTILGFLSHLTFIHFYLAAMVWSAFHFRHAIRHFFWLHTLPCLFLAIYYLIFIRHLTIGGAPDASILSVFYATLSLLIGNPSRPSAISLITIGFLVIALYYVYRRDRGIFPFYLTCLFISPAIFLLFAGHAEAVFPRYFLVSLFFALLLFGRLLAFIRRPVAILVVAFYVLGNLYQTTLFLQGTRGHYLQALQYIATDSDARPGTLIRIPFDSRAGETSPASGAVKQGERESNGIRISADDSFRTQLLLDFYARYLPPHSVIYVSPDAFPDWFIINTPQSGVIPSRPILINDAPYTFDREFTYYGLSGWSWYLFRRCH